MLIIEMHALDNVKSPREKLEILLGIHKILVDGLTFPPDNSDSTSAVGGENSNSSADMLLPVLIYRYPVSFLSLLCFSVGEILMEVLFKRTRKN